MIWRPLERGSGQGKFVGPKEYSKIRGLLRRLFNWEKAKGGRQLLLKSGRGNDTQERASPCLVNRQEGNFREGKKEDRRKPGGQSIGGVPIDLAEGDRHARGKPVDCSREKLPKGERGLLGREGRGGKGSCVGQRTRNEFVEARKRLENKEPLSVSST